MSDKMTLLITDDRPDNLLIISSLVSEYFPNIEIFTASCAADGIRLAIERQLDVGLIDVQMPEMDGIEMCRRLKADPRTRQMALILLTAHSAEPTLKARGLEAGADDFINRPFDNAEFVARVKVMLRIKCAEGELRDVNQNLEERIADKTWELHRNEERLRQISENSQEWIWEVDADGLYTYCSPSVKMLGYTPGEVVGKKSYSDFFHPADQEELKCAAFQTFGKKQPFRGFVNRNIAQNGETLWLETGGVPVIDRNGDLLGYRGADSNITERIRAENLQNAQLRLIDLAATHTIPEFLQFFLVEAKTLIESEVSFYHFVEADQETLSLQAWSTNTVETMGTNISEDSHYPISTGILTDCFHQRKPVIYNDYASILHKKDLPEGHAPIIRQLVVPVIREKRVMAILGVGNKTVNYTKEDVITLQRLADVGWETVVRKRIDAERALLMSAIEQAAESIVITDKQGLIQFVNPTFEKITGYSREETLNQDPRIFSSGKTPSSHYQEMWDRLLCGESWRGRFVNKKKDGTFYTEDAVVSPVIDAAGVTTHYVAVKTDITQSLEQEEKLKVSQGILVQQEKLAAIGQLAAGVAHEINNPVGYIASNLSSLRKYGEKLTDYLTSLGDIFSSLSSEQQLQIKERAKQYKVKRLMDDMPELIEEALEGTTRIQKIVQGLKCFARQDSDTPAPVDINESLESAITIIWNEIKYNSKLERDFGELPPINGFSQQLGQVFMNLIVNASHAIEKDGIIQVKSRYDQGNIVVSIQDNGCGISEANLKKIFDPFFTTKAIGKGTGLGMSIASEIIQKHGGTISVKSIQGEGTTFIISLPENGIGSTALD